MYSWSPCLTGLALAKPVNLILFVLSHAAKFKPVKQGDELYMILPPLVRFLFAAFPACFEP